jgi:hypothetical protein
MPRRSKGPRLYLDPKRDQFVIRDGTRFIRTGCGEGERAKAEKFLAQYLGQKHRPTPSSSPMIAEVLAAYGSEVAPDKPSARNIGYHISNLLKWWGEKRVSDISIKSCKEYVKTKTPAGAWGDLKVLKAAVKYWHGEYGPLDAMPLFWKPELNPPKERWLTRSEAARLLWAARRYQHLRRMILIGLYTGSRPGRHPGAALVTDRFQCRHDVEDARGQGAGQEEAGAEGQARPAHHGAPEALEAARRR